MLSAAQVTGMFGLSAETLADLTQRALIRSERHRRQPFYLAEWVYAYLWGSDTPSLLPQNTDRLSAMGKAQRTPQPQATPAVAHIADRETPLTVPQIAAMFGMSASFIRAEVREGRIRHGHRGRHYHIPQIRPSDFDVYRSTLRTREQVGRYRCVECEQRAANKPPKTSQGKPPPKKASETEGLPTTDDGIA